VKWILRLEEHPLEVLRVIDVELDRFFTAQPPDHLDAPSEMPVLTELAS